MLLLTRVILGVYGSWGGAPYGDLVNLMRHLEALPYLDMDRAAVAGGSYGGYLISWIFGQDLATKVCNSLAPLLLLPSTNTCSSAAPSGTTESQASHYSL